MAGLPHLQTPSKAKRGRAREGDEADVESALNPEADGRRAAWPVDASGCGPKRSPLREDSVQA